MRTPLLLAFIFANCIFCSAQQAIDQRHEINIGGIRQAVWVKGDDVNKPLFLFLHGGPGNSVMPYAKKFCDQLYHHFLVVHWDQREVGETLALNPSPVPLTLSVMQQDAQEIVDSLLHRFGRRKLYLAGHSWGTALGFHLVRTRPAQLEAFIAIGSMVNQHESERIALELMKTRAIRAKDHVLEGELLKVQIPFGDGEQLYIHRKALLAYTNSRTRLPREFVLSWADKWLPVFNEAAKENLFETFTEAHCPVYFFQGRNDLQTNSILAEQYYQRLKAPAKAFYWFEKAGHSIPSAFGAKMQQIIIQNILKPSSGL